MSPGNRSTSFSSNGTRHEQFRGELVGLDLLVVYSSAGLLVTEANWGFLVYMKLLVLVQQNMSDLVRDCEALSGWSMFAIHPDDDGPIGFPVDHSRQLSLEVFVS